MKICAIVTARGGSKSILKKNIILINNIPLLHYPLTALAESKYDIDTFVNTDCPQIASSALKLGVQNLPRPDFLAGDTVNHGDAIRDAALQYCNKFGTPDFFIVLIGNTVMIDGQLINQCLDSLIDQPDFSGLMTVWEAADDHPFRALKIVDGSLEEFSPRNVNTDRHTYEPAYFYDQGVWLVRSEYIFLHEGPSPWTWMGPKVLPIVRPWITGRDINGPFDVPFHSNWDHLKNTPTSFTY
ncbi:cytidylyltransferase domain-containing protein [Synechococcus sp. KORDI-49]|uniref:acylneuraminate cytidylyltransferase family protein n=1 Tax=Synechococcus sp. KORDI-49 TaxID=585423 RepID=UPI0008FF8CCB|nr:hypothetical protein [Synechococcus sp. KORDI-49]